jgi:predicted transcriptional regulator
MDSEETTPDYRDEIPPPYTFDETPDREGGRTERLEVRLDPQRQHMLREIAAVYEVPRSEVVRKMIDDAYDDVLLERRRAAVRRIVALQADGELMPDPDELSRQLAEKYEALLPE